MKEKIARAVVDRLIRYVPEYILMRTSDAVRITKQQREMSRKADEILRLVEPLKAENDRLHRQVEDQQAAYDALVAEMEEMLYGC